MVGQTFDKYTVANIVNKNSDFITDIHYVDTLEKAKDLKHASFTKFPETVGTCARQNGNLSRGKISGDYIMS